MDCLPSCPVCGLQLDRAAWDGNESSLDICPCCGIQFGYDDATPKGIEGRKEIHCDWRRRWIEEGMKWRGVEKPPPDWNPTLQLERLGDGGS
jgi:hypothetical protein